MSSSSIIMFGITLGALLIVACISFNAAKFYNELDVLPSVKLDVKPDVELRDRTS